MTVPKPRRGELWPVEHMNHSPPPGVENQWPQSEPRTCAASLPLGGAWFVDPYSYSCVELVLHSVLTVDDFPTLPLFPLFPFQPALSVVFYWRENANPGSFKRWIHDNRGIFRPWAPGRGTEGRLSAP